MTVLKTSQVLPVVALALFLFMLGLSPLSAQQASALKGHDTTQILDFSADESKLKQKKGQVFLTGTVRITQGDLVLTADQIVVLYNMAEGFDDPAVQRLDATGGVKLTSPSETVTSEWAVYDVEKRIVTLGGVVVYDSKDASIKGDRLELNLLTGLVKLDGQTQGGEQRVKGRFSVPKPKDK